MYSSIRGLMGIREGDRGGVIGLTGRTVISLSKDASQQAQRNTVPVIKVLAICPGSQRRRSCGAGEQGAAVAKQGLFKEYWNIPIECFNVQSNG